MASFAVKFLGCKVSQADAMLARQGLLAAAGAAARGQLVDVRCLELHADGINCGIP